MRILAIGGAGDMGRAALAAVAQFREVERITVADIDAAAAETTAATLGAKARSLQLDVLDAASLASALHDADAVLNTCGPFFRYGLILLKAAIAARKPYFDICDDPEPTLGMLTQDRLARENGIPAIIGLGASPGITNMLALKARQQLDLTERLYTCWNVDGKLAEAEFSKTHPQPSAAYVHWMQQLTGDISIYQNGARNIGKPLTPVTLRIPGRGKRRLYTCGHPEAVTLGRNFPDLAEAPNLMVLGTELRLFLTALADQVNTGRMTIDNAAGHLARQNSAVLDLDSKLKILFSKLRTPAAMPELFAVAQGTKNGRATQAVAELGCFPELSMAALTGIPLALGLRLFLDGKITDTGVHAPETIINPDDFFAALLPWCTVPSSPKSIDELVKVSIA